MPGTFERFERLDSITSRSKPRPELVRGLEAAERLGWLRRSRFRSSTRRRRSRSRDWSDSAKSSRQSSSVSTAPVGLPGEHTYSSCVRAQIASGTAE